MSDNSQPTEAYDATQDPGNAAQKPGYKTTEFGLASIVSMMTGAISVLSAVAASGLLDLIPGDTASKVVAAVVAVLTSLVSAATALGYSKHRSAVKIEGAKSAALVAASQPPSSPTNPT